MNKNYSQWTYWYYDGTATDEVGDVYVVPNTGDENGYYFSSDKGYHWEKHKDAIDNKLLISQGFIELYFNEAEDLQDIRCERFIRFMETKEIIDHSHCAINFLYKENETKSKGRQAYFYAYPVQPGPNIVLVADYYKWHCHSAKDLRRGHWGRSENADTLNVAKLVKKGFKTLDPKDVKDMIGQSSIETIYKRYGFSLDNAQLERPNRFRNLI